MHRSPTARRALIVLIPALCLGLISASMAQTPGESRTRGRQPFARAGTPKQAERVRTFDVQHIKGELTLDIKKAEIRGTVTHTLRPLHPNLDAVTLDCGADLKVSRVAVGNAACKYEQKGDELIIKLDKPYGLDDTVALAVTYLGSSPEKGVRFVKPDADHPDRQVCVWTQGEPEDARFWLPCFDYPNEKSTCEMVVTVDKPLTVVSNGTLESTKDNDDGTRTFAWKMDSPLTTYLISITAADFAVYHDRLDNLPVDYYVLKEVDEATARRAMGKTPKMIAFFNDKIGTPYAYPKYATVCLPEFGGGMEHSSATTMTDSILSDPVASLERDADDIVAHELAHQWFGDLLTCRDWSNLWLNEGFASYFDPLFVEHDRGVDAFQLDMAGNLDGYLASDRGYRRPIVEPRFNDPWQMFDGVTYSKGSCVLHALRGLVGDDAWWRGIKAYVARYKDQSVVTDDFRRSMEQASGRDLGWFFDQWVFHGGHPELSASWRYEDDDKTVRLKVEQTQAVDEVTPLFRLPTTVELGDDAGVRDVAIVIDAKTHEFVIPAAIKPKMVRIDPKGWLPKVLTFDKPLDQWIYQLAHATNYLGRREAAKALATARFKQDKGALEALAAAWKREKYVQARQDLVQALAGLEEAARPALLEAAKDADARVRVEAIKALAALKLDPDTEKLLRATWTNKAEAYSARGSALTALCKIKDKEKEKDADELITSALKDPANSHSFGVAALQTLFDAGGQKAREAAVLYSRPGQPIPLRAVAIRALGNLGKDDPQLEKPLVALIDDANPRIQAAAMFAITSAGYASALPKLEEKLPKLTGRARQRLEEQIAQLKNARKPANTAVADTSAREAGDLERQALDLELQARELRNKAEALKLKAERAKLAAPKVSSN